MRVASWNVDSIRARRDLVVDWVDQHEPDVLCLQETKCIDAAFPTKPFVERGYEVIAIGPGGQGGVAMLSRLGFDDVQRGIPGAVAPLADPRSISATIDGLRVHTIYAPNGRKVGTDHHAIKLAWFRLLTAWIEIDQGEGEPVLLIGDFNIAPLDIDIWEASRYRKRNLTSPPERAAFRALEETGLIDIVRAEYGPDHRVYSWWNRRAGFFDTDRGWRLDHALASPDVAERATAVWLDRDARANAASPPSDHVPLVVDLATS